MLKQKLTALIVDGILWLRNTVRLKMSVENNEKNTLDFYNYIDWNLNSSKTQDSQISKGRLRSFLNYKFLLNIAHKIDWPKCFS
jgi:hypothetical protein